MNLKLTDFNMEVTDSDTNSSNYKETNKSEPSNTSPEDDATGCEDEDEDELLPSTSSSCKSTQLKPSLDSACSSIPVSSSNVEIGSSRSPKCYTKLPADVRVCLIGDCASDTAVCAAARVFGYPVVTDPQCTAAKDGNDPQNGGCIVYVMREFAGEAYEVLHKTRHRIIGPTALCQLADRHLPMPLSSRPLYSLSMSGLVVCFTGFRKKEDLTRLIGLIHHMGGSIRKDMVSKVTHLIANCTGGEKYRYAMTFRVPVVSAKWVESSWEKRQDVTHDARNEAFISEHKLKPFQGSRVCFLGFPADEQQHMSEILVENGGVLVELEDPSCTHVVVDESTTGSAPETATSKTQIVKAEWFWKSVQNEEQADEREYLFENYLESLLSTPARTATPANVPGISTPASGPSSTRQRKRRRLHETLSALAQTDTTLKRRSSVSDAGLLSVSGSFLDCTVSPDKQLLDEGEGIEINRKNLSPRQQVFLELVQTESNYVSILHTIMTMFKSPLEEMLETSPNEAILNATELKIIFGNLPPIYDLHRKMLEELRWASSHWAEDTSIGNIILKHAPDLVKAYPPFVNFFENMKEMLVQCDQSKTRFHAFLKICQTRPECGRQSLQELMIRPVQRLPSISLLLNDILKHTPKSNLDYNALEKALESIKEVMTYINEDKRKTEAQMVMFDIFNDIDNCPPHLVSSHRSFISRCEVMELSDGLSGRGDHLVLYLFSDILEVCKKRSKAFNSLKSPNAIGSTHSTKLGAGKPYKHVKLMPLSHVKRVIDIHETEDCHAVFALTCRSNQELKEKLYSFTITEEDVDKTTFLRSLCRQMANTVCKADADRFMASLNSKQLEIDTSDVSLGTLSKAFKFASRTRMKVGRAFSFNKTPSKFKRAVSTMMSPFGSTNNLTPSSQLAQMRLASCNNINELGGAPNNVNNEMLVAPMSVQPTRKTKCSSLSIAALRRL